MKHTLTRYRAAILLLKYWWNIYYRPMEMLLTISVLGIAWSVVVFKVRSYSAWEVLLFSALVSGFWIERCFVLLAMWLTSRRLWFGKAKEMQFSLREDEFICWREDVELRQSLKAADSVYPSKNGWVLQWGRERFLLLPDTLLDDRDREMLSKNKRVNLDLKWILKKGVK